jgi:hypothetical protein
MEIFSPGIAEFKDSKQMSAHCGKQQKGYYKAL